MPKSRLSKIKPGIGHKGFYVVVVIALFAITTGGAYALNLGGVLKKGWEKREAITKTAKAMRKGFADITDEEEYYIGRAVAARILKSYRLVNDKNKTAYLNKVGVALSRYSARPELFGGYHFALIESKELNAFAAPGGFIFITTGLYRSVKNEEELAGVLAHEISHVTLKHGLGAIKSSRLTEAFTILGTEAVKEYAPGDVGKLVSIFEGTIDDIVEKLVISGYSKSQEYGADKEAIMILRRIGYAPGGLLASLEALDAQKGKKKAGFFKTHPPANSRIKKIKGIAKKGKFDFGKPASVRTKRFQSYALK